MVGEPFQPFHCQLVSGFHHRKKPLLVALGNQFISDNCGPKDSFDQDPILTAFLLVPYGSSSGTRTPGCIELIGQLGP